MLRLETHGIQDADALRQYLVRYHRIIVTIDTIQRDLRLLEAAGRVVRAEVPERSALQAGGRASRGPRLGSREANRVRLPGGLRHMRDHGGQRHARNAQPLCGICPGARRLRS